MNQLSDLLDEVKAGAPPARYDVDDVVAAGKRRLRRRNSGWAAVAAVAVAAAIGVPRIAAIEAPPGPGPRPAATATVTPEFTFTGFRAGQLRVDDPSTWSLAGQTANIRRPGSPDIVGTLKVYHPGVDPVPGGYRRQQAASDVKPAGGRWAFEVPLNTVHFTRKEVLIGWEYAAGAVATVEGARPGSLTRAELRQVAASFTTGRHRPVTLAFRPPALPAGYRVVSVTSEASGRRRSAVDLAAVDEVAARLARPAREASTGEPQQVVVFSLDVDPEADAPTKPNGITPSRTAVETCGERGTLQPMRICRTPVLGGTAELLVGARGGAYDVRRAIATTELADPAEPATWWPVADAIPASALPPAR